MVFKIKFIYIITKNGIKIINWINKKISKIENKDIIIIYNINSTKKIKKIKIYNIMIIIMEINNILIIKKKSIKNINMKIKIIINHNRIIYLKNNKIIKLNIDELNSKNWEIDILIIENI